MAKAESRFRVGMTPRKIMEDGDIPPLNQKAIQGWGTQVCGWSGGIQLQGYEILMVIPPGFASSREMKGWFIRTLWPFWPF